MIYYLLPISLQNRINTLDNGLLTDGTLKSKKEVADLMATDAYIVVS